MELIDERKETKQIKNDIKTMEMFLKEYLDYSEKIKIKKFSKINILKLLNEVIKSSKLLEKKLRYFVARKLILIQIKIIFIG